MTDLVVEVFDDPAPSISILLDPEIVIDVFVALIMSEIATLSFDNPGNSQYLPLL